MLCANRTATIRLTEIETVPCKPASPWIFGIGCCVFHILHKRNTRGVLCYASGSFNCVVSFQSDAYENVMMFKFALKKIDEIIFLFYFLF